MTRAQRTRINLEVAYGRDPSRYLSPRQLQVADSTDADRDPVGYRRDEAFRLR